MCIVYACEREPHILQSTDCRNQYKTHIEHLKGLKHNKIQHISSESILGMVFTHFADTHAQTHQYFG